MITSWNTSEPPPKDRPIILMGGVFVKADWGCFKDFVLCIAHYDAVQDAWLDSDGTSLRLYAESELQCYAWSEIPPDEAGRKPIVLEEALPEKTVSRDDTMGATKRLDTSEEAEPVNRRAAIGEEALR